MECGGKIEGLGDLSPVPGMVFVSGNSSDGQGLAPACLQKRGWECVGLGSCFYLWNKYL